jgi:beta-mannosidase
MEKVSLNGLWKMKRTDESEWINAVVPGSVYNDLLNSGKIQDPFYRENEHEIRVLSRFDYEYEREFEVSEKILTSSKVILNCEGLDTLAKLMINGVFVSETNNMHRHYEFDVKKYLKVGMNKIHIVFYSPIEFIEKAQKRRPLWGVDTTIAGYPHIRKAHCMFGWDWGPQLPDAGIWRNIELVGFSYARLDGFYVTQKHYEDKIELNIDVDTEIINFEEDYTLEVEVVSPTGEKTSEIAAAADGKTQITVGISNPKLWWPNGYGEQNLYTLNIVLKHRDNVIGSLEKRVGLRTLTIRKEPDKWGETFNFLINDIDIFAMGANYIPEDSILARCNKERTRQLIESCVEANFNCIRVWGGAYYPEDYFYDLCDEYGLIVWQDFMFACGVYDLCGGFEENISREFEDNIKRLRNHASLGMWCGNNEMEMGWLHWGIPQDFKLKLDYIRQFEVLIPEMIRKYDPNTFYWPASPSSGGGFLDPTAENKGDVHYWDVWHGRKPFKDFRKYYFRFASEYGFQSFPSMKTVKTFTLPEDRNISSAVMENHQKCGINGYGNRLIMEYLLSSYKNPKDFEATLYASQIVQAEGIKMGIEHWRRNRGRCMGSTYWQVNDCYPAASWSSIDCYGRWKAMHYYARRFYAPVLASVNDEGANLELHITNDTLKEFNGFIDWRLINQNAGVLREGDASVKVNKLSAKLIEDLNFSEQLKTSEEKRNTYFEYTLYGEDGFISSSTVLFVEPKHFQFKDPEICVDVTEHGDKFIIKLTAKQFAKSIELDFEEADGIFSDNYFDLSSDRERVIELERNKLSTQLTLEEVKKELKIRSVFDIA